MPIIFSDPIICPVCNENDPLAFCRAFCRHFCSIHISPFWLQEMRRKVGEMMKLLSDRKNKLKTTEVVIDKKGKTVDNINKILNRKHRREDHIEKEKVDRLLFGKKK